MKVRTVNPPNVQNDPASIMEKTKDVFRFKYKKEPTCYPNNHVGEKFCDEKC